MGLTFHPKPGEIFMCEFPTEYMHGEMIKKRPVIVLNRQLPGRSKLVNIVPISMTAPQPACSHHVEIERSHLPKGLRDKEGERWVKCDMIYTMSIERLELVQGHRDRSGKRVTDKGSLPPALLLAIRLATANCIGVHSGCFTKVNEPALSALTGLPEDSANGCSGPEAIGSLAG